MINGECESLIGVLVANRKKQRISQGELAKELGITQPSMSRIESLKHQPTLQQVFVIAKRLNLEISISARGE